MGSARINQCLCVLIQTIPGIKKCLVTTSVMMLVRICAATLTFGFLVILFTYETFPPFVGSLIANFLPNYERFQYLKLLLKILVPIFTEMCLIPPLTSICVLIMTEIFLMLASFVPYLQHMKKEAFISQYRQVQVLVQNFNLMYQETYFFRIMVLTFGFIVIFAFAIIKMHASTSVAQLACMCVPSFGGMAVVMFLFTKGSKAEIASEEAKRSWVRFQRKRNVRLVLKLSKSCRPLYVKFGKHNFMERTTPLVIFSNLIQLTIQLSLMTN